MLSLVTQGWLLVKYRYGTQPTLDTKAKRVFLAAGYLLFKGLGVSGDCHVYSFPVGKCLVIMENDKNKTVSMAERNVGKRGGGGGGGEAKGRGGNRNGRKRAKTIDQQQPEGDEEPETVPAAVEEAEGDEEVKVTTTIAAGSEDVTDTKDISETKEGTDQAKKKLNSGRKKITAKTAKRELSCVDHPTAVFQDISDLRLAPPLSFFV